MRSDQTVVISLKGMGYKMGYAIPKQIVSLPRKTQYLAVFQGAEFTGEGFQLANDTGLLWARGASAAMPSTEGWETQSALPSEREELGNIFLGFSFTNVFVLG